MAIELKGNIVQPKRVEIRKTFTKKEKDVLIKRFKAEMINKEREFQESVNKEIELLRLKFNNRLNKILRKFWDVKIEDILKIEREMKNDTPLTLFNVIKQLEEINSLKKDQNIDIGTNN